MARHPEQIPSHHRNRQESFTRFGPRFPALVRHPGNAQTRAVSRTVRVVLLRNDETLEKTN